MDAAKVEEVCREYRQALLKRWEHWEVEAELEGRRFGEVESAKRSHAIPTVDTMRHLYFLLGEIPGLMAQGRTDKAMRWLGWVQGALWGLGFETLHDAKLRNAPKGADYSGEA